MTNVSTAAGDQLKKTLEAGGVVPTCLVRDGQITDIAVQLGRRRAVVRCAPSANDNDRFALKTMLAQGDFDRAILVYCDKDQSELPDDIETWWIGDIEALVASLARGDAPS